MVHQHTEYFNEFNCSSWYTEYNGMISIPGITQKQKELLNVMWDIDTQEGMLSWFDTLDDDEFQQAVTLHEMILIAMMEHDDRDNLNLAQKMLADIGVVC